jgi:hypothetical protein
MKIGTSKVLPTMIVCQNMRGCNIGAKLLDVNMKSPYQAQRKVLKKFSGVE